VFIGRAMAQAVSLRRLTTKARVHSQVSLYEICGGQVALGQVFLRVLRVFLSVPFHQCCIIIFSYCTCCVTRRTNECGLGTFEKAFVVRKLGSTVQKSIFISYLRG